ncbi:MAG: hypothetical protein ACK5N0_10570 [Synechococcaceae cyanobacterium]
MPSTSLGCPPWSGVSTSLAAATHGKVNPDHRVDAAGKPRSLPTLA